MRTSDPDVANYTLTKTTKSGFNAAYIASVNKFLSGNGTESPIDTSFTLIRGAGKIERKPVDLDNEIKWQDDPGDGKHLQIYQAVTIATRGIFCITNQNLKQMGILWGTCCIRWHWHRGKRRR